MPRKYTKKSDYWKKFETQRPLSEMFTTTSEAAFAPELLGEAFYTSDASYSHVSKARANTAGGRSSRVNAAALNTTFDRYSSIRKGLLPYEYAGDGVSVRESIELCQKAYANVAIFRNAVDIMSEFANTEVYLEGGTKKSREFFEQFFKKINLSNLKDQYFREFYRSGNIFLYRFDGEFKADDYAKLMNQVGSINSGANKVPVKYAMLNPYDIVSKNASTFNANNYEKVLSQYELARLRDPQTEEDQEIYDSLDDELKKMIKEDTFTHTGAKLKLEPDRLSFSFYKKQDYEPFAIPFGYPVLEDINAKLELKKMDQAITRTVENVILLITMGAEPEKGGVNANNINAMQSLFKNESVGRVLVSDYTTKADFVLPDLNRVLGSEKYVVLNEDIKQGLQNIVIGEEKYNSTQVKAQIFLDRLKEARNAFLNDFLQREIKRVANDLGFKSYPIAIMKDVDVRDEVQLMRVATRLMELGVLTPQQGMNMFHHGKFPEAKDIAPAQKEFIDQRKEGYYNPIVGGIPMVEKVETVETKKEEDKGQNQTHKSAGRPNDTKEIPIVNAQYSRSNIQQTVYDIESLTLSARNQMENKLDVKQLSEQQVEMASKLCESIVCSTPKEHWGSTLESCVADFNTIEYLNTLGDILSVSSEHNLDVYPSAILYHSQHGL